MAAGEDERGHAAARPFDAIFVGYHSTFLLDITASSDRIGLKVLRHRSLPRRGCPTGSVHSLALLKP
jgi:hypothetical protein